MQITANPYRGRGIDPTALHNTPLPSIDVSQPAALMRPWMDDGPSPLWQSDGLAQTAGVAEFWLKDERARMGLGSFKALGAGYAIARQAGAGAGPDALVGHTFVAASAGNHGISVAAGAARFGADAIIYLADTVPEDFEQRLQALGAKTVRDGATYEDSMHGAERASSDAGWTLLSDSSWPGYFDMPSDVMAGYLIIADETAQMIDPPTHIFLQAGVGGMAGALAAYFRHVWANGPQIIVVEPEYAPALHDSILAGRSVDTSGPVSEMGRLDCKTSSLIALAGLSRDADHFALVSEAEVAAAMPVLAAAGAATTPSGGAGAAAAMIETMGLSSDDRVLCFLSESAAA